MSRIRIPLITLTIVIAGIVAATVATSGGASPTKAPASASAISVKQTPLGPTLADAQGRTLYLFQGDKPNVSTLPAAGQAIWPPFTANVKPRALSGVTAAGIAMISGGGGASQVTYRGHPLYYYVGDRGPGQVHGQGLNQFGALWYILGPSGSAVTAAPSPQASPMSNGGGAGSYGY